MFFHLHFLKRPRNLRMLDRVIYAVGVIGPLFTIPQLVKIYYLQDASGVSALSWGAYALSDIPWILYGMAHREGPITFTYSLWLVFNTLVFVGTIIYSAQPF